YAKSVERDAKARAQVQARDENGRAASRREGSSSDPNDRETDAEDDARVEAWDSWDIRHLSGVLGQSLLDGRLNELKASERTPITGSFREVLDEDAAIQVTRPRTLRFISSAGRTDASPFSAPEVLLTVNGEPILVELGIGRGKLLLLSEPRLLQ